MAFWGIQVKAGKPYTHQHQLIRRRLHISQATLGSGGSTNKNIFVQCNVGDRVPVLLCSLIPEKTESCPLNLEFDEAQDVVFSVIGTKTVHLTGYYLTHHADHHNDDDDDTESYGEDIAETGSDESNNDHDSLDTYEDDFIDDGEPKIFPSSPQLRDEDMSDEIEDEEQPMKGIRIRRRLVKKHHLSDSDADDGFQQKSLAKGTARALVLDSEDEDVLPLAFTAKLREETKKKEENDITQIVDDKNEDELPISFIIETKSTCQNEVAEDKLDGKTTEAGKKREIKADNDISQVTTLKRRVNAIDQGGIIERETIQPCDSPISSVEVGAENGMRLKKKRKIMGKEGKCLEPKANLPIVEKVSRDRDTTIDDSKSGVQRVGNAQHEAAKVNNMDQSLPVRVEDKKLDKDMKVINSSVASGMVVSENSANVKEKKKEKAKDKTTQAVDKTGEETAHNQKKFVEDGKIVNDKKLLKSKEVGRIANMDQEMPNNAQEPNVMLLDDKSLDVNSDHANSDTKKEKKKKVKDHESVTNSNKEECQLITGEREKVINEIEEQNDEVQQPLTKRTFSNGMVIEEPVNAQEPNAMLLNDKSLDVNSDHANSNTKKKDKKKKKKKKKKVEVHESDTNSNKEECQLVTGERKKVINEIEEQKGEVQQPLTERTSSNGMITEEPINAQEPNAMLLDEKSLDVNSDHANSNTKKKEKKKKKKVKVHESDTNSNKEECRLVMGEREKVINEFKEQKDEVQQPLTTRTSSNGMVIEELLRGSQEGKRASSGNKVYVHYTGEVKNGEIFNSTIGRKPSKFRLGRGRVIEGMDVGIEGMYVGDKRRLIIPPAMGYGVEGEGEVPGNAWLIIDVELVKIC